MINSSAFNMHDIASRVPLLLKHNIYDLVVIQRMQFGNCLKPRSTFYKQYLGKGKNQYQEKNVEQRDG